LIHSTYSFRSCKLHEPALHRSAPADCSAGRPCMAGKVAAGARGAGVQRKWGGCWLRTLRGRTAWVPPCLARGRVAGRPASLRFDSLVVASDLNTARAVSFVSFGPCTTISRGTDVSALPNGKTEVLPYYCATVAQLCTALMPSVGRCQVTDVNDHGRTGATDGSPVPFASVMAR
jgi:hypothetical protein